MSKESGKNKCCNLDERDCRDVVTCDDSIACYGRGASHNRSVIAARSNCSSYSCPVPKGMMKRHPFALIEVCVAIILIGMVVGYLIDSGWETLRLYSRFQTQIALEERAEEEFSLLLASYLITPPEFESLKPNKPYSTPENFLVETKVTPTYCQDATPPIALVDLVLTVKNPPLNGFATRSTSICVVKGKPDKSTKEERE